MCRCPNLAILVVAVVELFTASSSAANECIHVDFLDAGGVRKCAQDHTEMTRKMEKDPETVYMGFPQVTRKTRYIEKNYALECQGRLSLFTKKLPSLLRCTRNSKHWSWQGESVLVMQEVVVRLVMELNSSRVEDVKKQLKNFFDQTKSRIDCTSYERAVDAGLANCFVRSGSCQEDLATMFLCLINHALDLLDPKTKKELTCELFAIISHPFLPQSWRELTMVLVEINAVCPQFYLEQEERKVWLERYRF